MASTTKHSKDTYDRCSNGVNCHGNVKKVKGKVVAGQQFKNSAIEQKMHVCSCNPLVRVCNTEACRKQHDDICSICVQARIKQLEQKVGHLGFLVKGRSEPSDKMIVVLQVSLDKLDDWWLDISCSDDIFAFSRAVPNWGKLDIREGVAVFLKWQVCDRSQSSLQGLACMQSVTNKNDHPCLQATRGQEWREAENTELRRELIELRQDVDRYCAEKEQLKKQLHDERAAKDRMQALHALELQTLQRKLQEAQRKAVEAQAQVREAKDAYAQLQLRNTACERQVTSRRQVRKGCMGCGHLHCICYE
jgi:hypothetical protein